MINKTARGLAITVLNGILLFLVIIACKAFRTDVSPHSAWETLTLCDHSVCSVGERFYPELFVEGNQRGYNYKDVDDFINELAVRGVYIEDAEIVQADENGRVIIKKLVLREEKQ